MVNIEKCRSVGSYDEFNIEEQFKTTDIGVRHDRHSSSVIGMAVA